MQFEGTFTLRGQSVVLFYLCRSNPSVLQVLIFLDIPTFTPLLLLIHYYHDNTTKHSVIRSRVSSI